MTEPHKEPPAPFSSMEDCLEWVRSCGCAICEAAALYLKEQYGELQRWSYQVHDALDGRPIEYPDEGPARIIELREQLQSKERELFATGKALANQDRYSRDLRKQLEDLQRVIDKFLEWDALTVLPDPLPAPFADLHYFLGEFRRVESPEHAARYERSNPASTPTGPMGSDVFEVDHGPES